MLIRLHDASTLITMNVLIKITSISSENFQPMIFLWKHRYGWKIMPCKKLAYRNKTHGRYDGLKIEHSPHIAKGAPSYAGKVTSCVEDVLQYYIRCRSTHLRIQQTGYQDICGFYQMTATCCFQFENKKQIFYF